MGYVPGTATQKRARRANRQRYARVPEIWTPAHVRANNDLSEFYEKPPQEMSRYELEELEKIMREIEEGGDEEEIDEGEIKEEYDADGNLIDKLA